MFKKIDFCYGIIFCVSLVALIIACISYTKGKPSQPSTLVNGTACFLDKQCDSGFCKGATAIAGKPLEGECSSKVADGKSCESNDECVNGQCNKCCAHGKYSNKYCCPGGKTAEQKILGIPVATWCQKTPQGKDGCVGGGIC